MNYLTRQIVFREIPDEISLSYLITGCSLHCEGCHSVDVIKEVVEVVKNSEAEELACLNIDFFKIT